MAKKKSNNKMRQTYGCMLCQFLCYDVEKQAQHWIEKHGRKRQSAEPEFPVCEYCGEKFRTKEGRDHHYQTDHQSTLII